jgi:hypothetical protein
LDEGLLASYETERKAFAERLVATTDRAFTFVTRDGFLARRVRFGAVPTILPALLDRKTFRRFLFRTVSQTLVRYRDSALSEGRAGSVHGGDRLPWVEFEQGPHADNFTPLESLDWQVHVYGSATHDLARTCAELDLTLHELPWSPRAERAGLERNAAYLVRPDGYVGLADGAASPGHLRSYLDARGIRASRAT